MGVYWSATEEVFQSEVCSEQNGALRQNFASGEQWLSVKYTCNYIRPIRNK